MPFPTRRLVGLFGSELEHVDATSVARLIGQTEEFDLEFKVQMYGGSDADRAEAAKDVAAFANYQGGVIIIGVSDSDGVATSVAPWDVSEADELRIREIVTERVVPYIDLTIQRVASQDASGGYLLVTVPGSSDAPHAVRVGDKFRYPVRDGKRTRFMAEAEIAASYRRRFSALEERGRRVEEVQSGGARHLLLESEPQRPWLTVTLVPLRPVNLNLDVAVRNTIEGQFREAINLSCPNTPFRGQAFLQQRVGVREVQITDSNMFGGAPRSSFAVLHADGSAFIAAAFWSGSNSFGDGTDVFQISRDAMTAYVLGLVDLACQHAVASGAGGDAVLAVNIARPPTGLDREIGLARDGNFIPPAAGWPRLDPSFAESRFTVPPRQIVDTGSELVAASFQVLADLEAAFGEPEPMFIRRDGTMTLQFGSIPGLAEWASLRQIELR
jgi:Putative DNA-binding domain